MYEKKEIYLLINHYTGKQNGKAETKIKTTTKTPEAVNATTSSTATATTTNCNKDTCITTVLFTLNKKYMATRITYTYTHTHTHMNKIINNEMMENEIMKLNILIF